MQGCQAWLTHLNTMDHIANWFFDQMNGPMDVEHPNRESNKTLVCYLNSSLIVEQVKVGHREIDK